MILDNYGTHKTALIRNWARKSSVYSRKSASEDTKCIAFKGAQSPVECRELSLNPSA
jgi:hypothetical protein